MIWRPLWRSRLYGQLFYKYTDRFRSNLWSLPHLPWPVTRLRIDEMITVYLHTVHIRRHFIRSVSKCQLTHYLYTSAPQPRSLRMPDYQSHNISIFDRNQTFCDWPSYVSTFVHVVLARCVTVERANLRTLRFSRQGLCGTPRTFGVHANFSSEAREA